MSNPSCPEQQMQIISRSSFAPISVVNMDEIEAAKAKQHSLRERLAARRQQRESLLAGLVSGNRSMNRSSINLPATTKTSTPEPSLSSSRVISSQSVQGPATQAINQDVKQSLHLKETDPIPTTNVRKPLI
ncbi:hypothetical protein AHF37_09452 [Paragonimus kellicotti]|nr:hypothetical protein AHF37_09452 [Paragonimus kellicotti]